ncbi:MAG: hypothetical protein M3P47_03755 [Pseudomonadota bacterium]|nr:hypothetical protein [Pseudomonadota bacterium]
MSQIQYQADGKIGQWTWSNTRIASRNFDTDGRLTGYSKATSNATIAYDNVDRIINLADTRGPALTQGFAYDPNDSLTHYTDNAMTQSYLYDADGNSNAQVDSTTTTYLYATNSNHLTHLKGARTEQFKYDAVGNIVNNATNNYTYDASNRLVKVSNRAGSGQRVAKLTGGSQGDNEHDDGKTNTTYFTYDTAGGRIGEYNRTRSQSTEYVWMANSPVAVLKKNGGDPAKLYTIHTDHLGTPRQVINAITNAVVWEWSGEPFGTSHRMRIRVIRARNSRLSCVMQVSTMIRNRICSTMGSGITTRRSGGCAKRSDLACWGHQHLAYGLGNPVSNTDPRGLDTYVANRQFSAIGTSAVPFWYPFSHTFRFSTNPDGSIAATYTWGNAAICRVGI